MSFCRGFGGWMVGWGGGCLFVCLYVVWCGVVWLRCRLLGWGIWISGFEVSKVYYYYYSM